MNPTTQPRRGPLTQEKIIIVLRAPDGSVREREEILTYKHPGVRGIKTVYPLNRKEKNHDR